MIISKRELFNFRKFKSTDEEPGLIVTFHKGLNALVGENDSGKSAIIDAIKLVLLTQSNEYIRPTDDDFYRDLDNNEASEFKINCTLTQFTQNEAKNFIEYLTFKKSEEVVDYSLKLHYCAWKEGNKIYSELKAGETDEGVSIDVRACELLKAVYLKPLRDAEREMSSGRGLRISQIMLNHPAFKNKDDNALTNIIKKSTFAEVCFQCAKCCDF